MWLHMYIYIYISINRGYISAVLYIHIHMHICAACGFLGKGLCEVDRLRALVQLWLRRAFQLP